MHPTQEEVEIAAYERWLTRGGAHGFDQSDWFGAEKELAFWRNYGTIADYRVGRGLVRVIGGTRDKTCRLCERGAGEACFDKPSPVISGASVGGRLLTAEVCMECWAECLEPLSAEYERFRDGQGGLTLRAYKAMVAAALLVMPARELAYFPDAVEWANNPDPDCDAGLFAGSSCRIYSLRRDDEGLSVTVARRADDEAAIPYAVLFVGDGGMLIQLDVPLCLRDEDLDTGGMRSPERSFFRGQGAEAFEAECRAVPVELGGIRTRTRESSSLVSC